MKIDVDRLTHEELLELYERISAALDAGEARRLSQDGVDSAQPEIGTADSDQTGTETRRVRYLNPENRKISWNGRGRCPNWFRVAMAEGRRPEDLVAP